MDLEARANALSEVPTVLLDGMDSMRLFPNLMRLRLKPVRVVSVAIGQAVSSFETRAVRRGISRRNVHADFAEDGCRVGFQKWAFLEEFIRLLFRFLNRRSLSELPHKTKDFPCACRRPTNSNALLPDARSSYAFENEGPSTTTDLQNVPIWNHDETLRLGLYATL